MSGHEPEYWRCSGEGSCGLTFRDPEGTEWVHQEATVVHALGHDWGAWEVTQEPTEKSPGIERRACSRDGRHVEFRLVPEKGHEHRLVRVEARAATCTEDGNTEYWRCSGKDSCGLSFRDPEGTEWVHEEATVVHALGHDWGESRYAWSDDDGEVSAHRVCLRDATHEEEETQATERYAYRQPTCTEAGRAVVVSRPFENEGFMRQAKTDVDVSELGHDWGEWEVTRKATSTAEGERVRTCTRCGEVERRAIPAEVTYRYVGQAMQAWTKGAATALELTFKRSVEDTLTFGLFEGVEVDGREVAERGASGASNYTTASGSLVLRLQPSFLETLAPGEHRIKALFKDGEASAAFVVRDAEKEGGRDGRKDDGKAGDDNGGDRSARQGVWPTLGTSSATLPVTWPVTMPTTPPATETSVRYGNVTTTGGATTTSGGRTSDDAATDHGTRTGAADDAAPGGHGSLAGGGTSTGSGPSARTEGGVAASVGSASGTTRTYRVVSPEGGLAAPGVVGSRASTPGTGDATSVAPVIAVAVTGAVTIVSAVVGRRRRRD